MTYAELLELAKRYDGRKAAEGFVARFSEIGSARPGDYSDVTRNASYFIGLILADLRERR